MLVRLCLVQDFSSLKKLPLSAKLSELCLLHPLMAGSVVSALRSVFWARRGLRSHSLRNFNEADSEGDAVNRVAKSGDHGSASIGSSA